MTARKSLCSVSPHIPSSYSNHYPHKVLFTEGCSNTQDGGKCKLSFYEVVDDDDDVKCDGMFVCMQHSLCLTD